MITVAIYKYPGHNALFDYLDMGPAFYRARKEGDSYRIIQRDPSHVRPQIDLQHFLDFAIGASEALEILHHGRGMIHGEIRGDAFHYNAQEGKARIMSFGSGVRSFEHGLTSTGWSSLSKELGVKNKLLYISPEQTGRMPAEPDSRTDIYSLGVLFWMLLTQEPVFQGENAFDIVQGVLGRRIPNVSTIRIDIPDAVGRIIQKCTAKNVTDRYHSASGLRHDLVQVQKYLGDGDLAALKDFVIAEHDVSSFFMLPTDMIGRKKEKEDIIKVINRVSRNHMHRGDGIPSQGPVPFATEASNFDDISSEGASSVDGGTRRSESFTQTSASGQKHLKGSSPHQSELSETRTISETTSTNQSFNTMPVPRITRRWERHQSISADVSSTIESIGSDGNRAGTIDSGASILSRQLGTVKYRRRGHADVITISGAGGLGKSLLVQSILPDARRRGYCSTAKFDTARRVPFGPIIKLLSSLIKQVWGERDTNTPFHQALKQYIRPVWPTLHRVLGLPEFLLGPSDAVISRSPSLAQSQVVLPGVRVKGSRRGSSPGISPAPSKKNSSSQSTHDFLRAGASTKTMRFLNTFLDVLRMFTHYKFVCFCLEDLHFADNESLELISQIVAARIKMVLVLSYRDDEMSDEKMRKVICPVDLEELPGSARPVITNIKLAPLTEEETLEYVAQTLNRPKDEVLSLALIIQSKAAGNPFYMREMLSASHRKRCIWYNYRDAKWHYDLDRMLDQFKGTDDYDVLGTSFVTRRLAELPPTARALLAWAALIGSSFSFELVCRLMTAEFDYDDEAIVCKTSAIQQKPYSEAEAVSGLHAALQAYIIVPSDTDDRFRFAHDRYIHASVDLEECVTGKMHFIIAQTLLKYYAVEARQMESTALHICKAKDIIKARIAYRREFRKLLSDLAQVATGSGARPTAAGYYSTAVDLLQGGAWIENEDSKDVFYDETLQLHFHAAECHLYMGSLPTANDLLTVIFNNARSAIDKAPAYVLQSRIFAQNGNSLAALISLKECLKVLGVELDEDVTYEKCDKRFHKLVKKIQGIDRSTLVNHPKAEDPHMASIGAVLSECTSAAWWSDCLQFYNITLKALEMHFEKGSFPQSGMSFLNLATVSLSRFSMTQFAVEMGTLSQDMLYGVRDAFSMARGQMLHACLISHIHCAMPLSVSQMDDAIELASVGGDRMSTILSYGLAAQTRLLASENLADLEGFCQFACEEIPNWHQDTRGGALLVAVKQVCRALQGKTSTGDPSAVLSDELHDSVQYKSWLVTQTLDSSRSSLFYESLELMVLFLYGHYDRAVEQGASCYDRVDILWSARNSRLILLFYGLSQAAQLFQWQFDPRTQNMDFSEHTQEVVNKLSVFVTMIMEWATVSDVNYICWSRMLEAQIAELSNQHGRAVQHYEEALDHATEHSFLFEEALGNYLMAGFFLRRKARRSARSALLETVGLFRQLGALGIARSIEEEHCLLLHGPTRHRQTIDAGAQTDVVADPSPVAYRPTDQEDGEVLTQVPSHTMTELRGERIGAWRGSMNMQADDWSGLPALDMIDLHAILVSSQVISSVLQIDELLKTMCDVILKTCGGTATMAAIVVRDLDGDSKEEKWCIAASGDPDNGASAHLPGLPLGGTSLIADNVVLYCTRFLEPVFIPDMISDERVGNVSETWLQRNPHGKSIIAIPITHGNKTLLGVLYMEGEPRAFTDRNVTVLQLLVNQISISYSNALFMKRVERVSAENRSMVSVQKQALAKALESETKAKIAETEAKRNVKLAEEAARAKAIFLANVSHELRTPLNGVIGNSELLRDSTLNKEQTEMADSIRVSADLLLTVINDILDFSKMEADKMKLHMIAFNPEELVREVVRAVSYSNREKTTKKNVKIIHDIELPSALMYGDPIRLHQVLGNLIGNSLKFTDQGSITIGARLDKETDKVATLTFWVRDTGIGIPPRQLAKLFQPFSQADSGTARKYGGSGLGLSICKSLIQTMMKGKIQLESEENIGTTAWFTVSFEKADSDVAAGDLQAKTAPAADVPSPQDRRGSLNPFMDLSQLQPEELRICIAEDNPINQKIAIQYVQRLGYPNVVAYENGMKAVEGLRKKAAEGNPYHIVLMDVMMPVLDGYEATKLIRKDENEAVRKVLVIAMTASAIQGDREKCLAAGMNDYLAKPVRSDVLRRKLEAYVNIGGHPSAGHQQANGSSVPPRHPQTEKTAPPKPPLARPAVTPVQTSSQSRNTSPRRRIIDPMEEGAVFNQPLDSDGYLAADSPTIGVERSEWIVPHAAEGTTPPVAHQSDSSSDELISFLGPSTSSTNDSSTSMATTVKLQPEKLKRADTKEEPMSPTTDKERSFLTGKTSTRDK